MNIITCIILSIITSITFFLNISTSTHIYILNNLLNTKIFTNQIFISSFYLFFIFTILIIFKKKFFSLIKNIITKDKKKTKYYLKYLRIIIIISLIDTIIYYLVPHYSNSLKTLPLSLTILSIIIFLSTNKKGNRKFHELTYFDSLFIGCSTILTFIPSINPLLCNLFFSKLRKINQNNSLIISFLSIIPLLIIKSIPSLIFIIKSQNYYLYFFLTFILSITISIKALKYFKYLYYQNKLYKLSIYIIILTLFLLYWYR